MSAADIKRMFDGAAVFDPDAADSPPVVHDLTPALLWFATLEQFKPQIHLVKNLLVAGSLFVIYGESSTGKTFLVLDLALSVAAGLPWRGRRTRAGLVLYIAGEGAESVRARVRAWRLTHPEQADLPFAIIPHAVDFLDSQSIDRLILIIRQAEQQCGQKLALLIGDTFARSMPSGDENSAQDVGKAVAAADRIRIETGACVAFVHHAGKDPTKGARGSSALRAACDTEILVEGLSGDRTATDTKQRDLMCGQKMPFALDSLQIDVDPDDGGPVMSCTVRHIDAQASQGVPIARGANQAKALTALTEWARAHPDDTVIPGADIQALLKAQFNSRPRRHEVLDYLTRLGILTRTSDYLGSGYTIDRDQLGGSVRTVRKRPNRTVSYGAEASETYGVSIDTVRTVRPPDVDQGQIQSLESSHE
jgi:hypothetical protein